MVLHQQDLVENAMLCSLGYALINLSWKAPKVELLTKGEIICYLENCHPFCINLTSLLIGFVVFLYVSKELLLMIYTQFHWKIEEEQKT